MMARRTSDQSQLLFLLNLDRRIPAPPRRRPHPLAPESGGNVFHSGGRQFASKRDPDWQALAAWINGATLGYRKK